MPVSIQDILSYDVDAEIRERLNFIQKYISLGNFVGYYEGHQFQNIKLTELVSFNNAIVVGTTWENYKDITDKDLFAVNAKGGMVAALKVPAELTRYLNYMRRG